MRCYASVLNSFSEFLLVLSWSSSWVSSFFDWLKPYASGRKGISGLTLFIKMFRGKRWNISTPDSKHNSQSSLWLDCLGHTPALEPMRLWLGEWMDNTNKPDISPQNTHPLSWFTPQFKHNPLLPLQDFFLLAYIVLLCSIERGERNLGKKV